MLRSIQLILGCVVIFSMRTEITLCRILLTLWMARELLYLCNALFCPWDNKFIVVLCDFIVQYYLLSLLCTSVLSACTLHFTLVLNHPLNYLKRSSFDISNRCPNKISYWFVKVVNQSYILKFVN